MLDLCSCTHHGRASFHIQITERQISHTSRICWAISSKLSAGLSRSDWEPLEKKRYPTLLPRHYQFCCSLTKWNLEYDASDIHWFWKDAVHVKVFIFDFCSLLFVFYYFGWGSWIGLLRVYFFNSRVGSAWQWNASRINKGNNKGVTSTFYIPNINILYIYIFIFFCYLFSHILSYYLA